MLSDWNIAGKLPSRFPDLLISLVELLFQPLEESLSVWVFRMVLLLQAGYLEYSDRASCRRLQQPQKSAAHFPLPDRLSGPEHRKELSAE